jgi:replicative DNA helicase
MKSIAEPTSLTATSVEEDKRTARLGEVINKLELLITKNRSGPTGTLDLFADMPCNYFSDAYNGGAA